MADNRHPTRRPARTGGLVRVRLGTALAVSAALILALLPANAGADPIHVPESSGVGLKDHTETVTADVLPTVQINGVVWDQVIVGNRVYVTGEFTHARPAGAAPGTNETPRSNILAYDLHTGDLIADWAPTLNKQGMAIEASPDGSRIYVGGDFDQVNGQWHGRVAALDSQTGQLISELNPKPNTRVAALAVTSDTVYFGGYFTVVAGQQRVRLAAIDAATGDLLPWTPTADRGVEAMAVHEPSGRVFAGGQFWELNGQEQPGMGALDAQTGVSLPWDLVDLIRNGGSSNSVISGLTIDGDHLYGVGWVFYAGGGDGTFEGTFSANAVTGELDWVQGCLGDRYDVGVGHGVVYAVGHQHDCGMVGYHMETSSRTWQNADALAQAGSQSGNYNAYGPFTRWHYFPGQPATDGLHWLPQFAFGDYTSASQAGWTVEATDEYLAVGGEFPSVNGEPQQGLARFAIRELAPNESRPTGFAEARPRLSELAPGVVNIEWTAAWDRDDRTLTYELLRGPTTSTSAVLGTWTVESDRWHRPPMGFVDTTAPAGNHQYRVRVTDPHGNGGPSVSSTITVSPGDPVASSAYAERVASLGPMSHWRLGEESGTTAYDMIGSDNLTLWNQAQRGASGVLLNEDDGATYWPASTSTAIVRGASEWRQPGPQEFTVEAWFNTTSTQGGKIVGFGNSRTGRSNSNITDRHIYMTNNGRLVFGVRPDFGDRRVIQSAPGFNNGQWHHVVATLSSDGARLYLDGELVAEDATLTKAQQYWGYWRVAGDRLTFWPSAPTREAFEGTIDEVAIYHRALTTFDIQGNYEASGRDGDFENIPPVADFDWDATFLSVDFDASASSDPDGEIVSYVWDFGDGSTATTAGPTVSHVYAEADTYTVSLTVTDDDDATGTTSNDVEVEADTGPPPPLAADSFERIVNGGWGTADIGGDWTVTGPSSSYAVNGEHGQVVLGSPGNQRDVYLGEISASDVDIRTDVALDQDVSGAGTYLTTFARRTALNTWYGGRLRFLADGRVWASVMRNTSAGSAHLTFTYLPDYTYTPGERLNIRFAVVGTDLRLKVWPQGQVEPVDWLIEASDDHPALQGPGTVGQRSYLSGSSTATPVTVSHGSFVVEDPE